MTQDQWLAEFLALTDAHWRRWASEHAQPGQPYTRRQLLRTWAGSPYYHQAAGQIGRALRAGLPYTLTADQWGQTLAYFGGACAYCGTWYELQTLEHWRAHSQGGGFVAGNIIPACRACNLSRRNRDPWLWAIYGAGQGKVTDSALSKIAQWAAETAPAASCAIAGGDLRTRAKKRGNHARDLYP